MSVWKWVGIGVGATVGGVVVLIGGAAAYVYVAFPDAGPVAEVQLSTDPAVIARGDYLANHVMGCTVCHTPADVYTVGHPAKEGLFGAGGRRFGGEELVLYSSNLTPAAIGGWSDAELAHAVTTGVTPQRKALFPLMPWPAYAQASKGDLVAVLSYIRTLKPVENTVPARSLPGPLPVIVNFMPKAASNPAEAPDRSDEVAYGKYLVTIAACGDCHTPMDDRGGRIPGMEYAGGMAFPMPGQPEYGTVRSANLTPDLTSGIGGWTKEQFIGRFKRGVDDPANGEKIEPGHTWSMMPWVEYGGMTEEDLGAIYAYLHTVPAVSNQVVRYEVGPGVEAKGPLALPALKDGYVERGALGAFCDSIGGNTAAASAFWIDGPSGPTWDAAVAKANPRGFPLDGLSAGLVTRIPSDRKTWIAEMSAAYGLDARCAGVLSAEVPAMVLPPEEPGKKPR